MKFYNELLCTYSLIISRQALLLLRNSFKINKINECKKDIRIENNISMS